MKHFYTLRRSTSSPYHLLHLSVYTTNDDSYVSLRDELFNLKWQTDAESDHWYGFGVRVEATYPHAALEQMQAASTFLERIIAANANTDQPATIIAALKIPRRVYDDRVSRYIPLEEAAPPEFQRWMAMKEGEGCILSALAPDRESASLALMKEFAAHIAEDGRHSDRYSKRLEAWIAAGKPIELDSRRNGPDRRTLEEMIKPLKAPVTQAAAA